MTTERNHLPLFTKNKIRPSGEATVPEEKQYNHIFCNPINLPKYIVPCF